MRKYFLAGPCIGCGILLCALNKSAFTALGILVGLAAAGAGAYLLRRAFQGDFPPLPALAAAALGTALLMICIVFGRVSLIIGGTILVAAGVVFIFFCRESIRIFLPFCAGCIIFGLLIIFFPLGIIVLSVASGVFLIFYGAIFAFYL